MSLNKVIFLLGIALTTQSLSDEKIYKWTDEKGQLHYSSQKPENKTSKEMIIKHSRTAPIASLENIDERKPDERIQNHYDKRDEKKLKEKSRRKQCNYSKNHLADIQSLGKCGWTDRETGKHYTHIPDDKRAQITSSIKLKIRKYCK